MPSNLGQLRHAQELRFYRNLFNGTIPPLSPHLCPEPRQHSLWKRSEQQFKFIERWPIPKHNTSKLKSIYFGKVGITGIGDIYASHLRGKMCM